MQLTFLVQNVNKFLNVNAHEKRVLTLPCQHFKRCHCSTEAIIQILEHKLAFIAAFILILIFFNCKPYLTEIMTGNFSGFVEGMQ